MDFFIGRTKEKKILEAAVKSNNAELIAVYGRRRVGKTFLIKKVCSKHIKFSFTGINNASKSEQLEHFSIVMQETLQQPIALGIPTSWLQAFAVLKSYLNYFSRRTTKVIFLDEIPWLDSHKSGFLKAFEAFWNSWAVNQPKVKVIICGSAASWMVKKIVNARGGLHNRITKIIKLAPFNLSETEAFLKAKNIKLDRYSVLQIYMAMGGIPHYLKEIEAGKSAIQNIDNICFSEQGLLRSEFGNLYSALYDNPDRHISVIKALANNREGLTRNQIVEKTKITSGGTLTKVLSELEESDFTLKFIPFDKKEKNAVYRLSDEYTLFYLKFIQHNKSATEGFWLQKSESQSWTSWAGFAFEGICMKHVSQIKQALQIAGIYSEISGWRSLGSVNKTGSQIDLIIDRNDRVINVCEMKFSQSEFNIDKRYNDNLLHKIMTFKNVTKTKKTIFLTFITTYGLIKNKYSSSNVHHDLKMDLLFEPERI